MTNYYCGISQTFHNSFTAISDVLDRHLSIAIFLLRGHVRTSTNVGEAPILARSTTKNVALASNVVTRERL